ncbi:MULTISPECIES: hypothetical protein [unclassified Brevibacterium]|uniref:hypothetical protein n=1 Tax=unclassified Brevibacterium TaxID=2614124 RepID=UPI00110069F5|nr:hypothetical protein [Brevibacterium sp. S22]TGD32592.1 hypothetical protein EB835_02565 [Brevibacterium sp. S22]
MTPTTAPRRPRGICLARRREVTEAEDDHRDDDEHGDAQQQGQDLGDQHEVSLWSISSAAHRRTHLSR